MSSPDGRASSTLLRYRFDSQEQLARHLNVVDTRGVLFFRDPRLSLQPGHPVLLEILIGQSDQQSLLRGHILGRDEGRSEGVWLEFPDARLARRAAEAATMVSRRQRRLPIEQTIELRGDGPQQLCRLLDISANGCHVGGLMTPARAGEGAVLRLVTPPDGFPSTATARAQVLRGLGAEAALRFVREDPGTRILVSKLMAHVQQGWEQAREIAHPPACCRGGTVLAPPLPRIGTRQTN